MTVGLGALFDPFTAFLVLVTIFTAVIIAIYIAVDLACLVFDRRERRDEFHPVLHGVMPVVGIAAFLPALLTTIGVGGSVLPFVAALGHPLSLAGPVLGVWFAIGLVYLFVLSRTAPERIRDTGRVFVEEPAPARLGSR